MNQMPARAGALMEMKNFLQHLRHGTVVRIRGHNLAHVLPPALTFWRGGDRRPTGFVLDLNVGKELPRFRVKEYGVIVGAVRFQHRLQFGPNRLMPVGVFLLLSGVHGHDECFSNHGFEGFAENLRPMPAGDKRKRESITVIAAGCSGLGSGQKARRMTVRTRRTFAQGQFSDWSNYR